MPWVSTRVSSWLTTKVFHTSQIASSSRTPPYLCIVSHQSLLSYLQLVHHRAREYHRFRSLLYYPNFL